MTVPVRLANPKEFPTLASTLAQSFEHDPMFRYLGPEKGNRMGRLTRGWMDMLKLEKSVVYCTDDLKGVAIYRKGEQPWAFTGGETCSMLCPGLCIDTGCCSFATCCGCGKYMGRQAAFTETLDSRHPHVKHAYLQVMGVHPDAQGKGYGTALIDVVRDAEEPIYVECCTVQNREWYKKRGFEILDVSNIRGDPLESRDDDLDEYGLLIMYFMWLGPDPPVICKKMDK